MRRPIGAFLLAALLLVAAPAAVSAQPTCTADTFRAIVDEAGRGLRRIHEEMKPRLDAGFKKLKAQRGWSDAEYVERASEMLADDRSEAFDAKASELLARLDRLAEIPPGTTPDCSQVGELEATVLELTAAIRGKLRHTLARLDAAIGEQAAAAAPAERPKREASPAKVVEPPASASPPSAGAGQAAVAPPPSPPARGRPPETSTPGTAPAPPPAAPAPRAPGTGWTTSTAEERVPLPPQPPAAVAPPMPPPQSGPATADGFSVDEIREASRGFFGTLSSELANVIEHAFAVGGGRPTAYILGNEGGGAFIAGVRYGRGTLFTRTGASREVYWHGPSIGYDFGASGSKTLFLVYRMRDPLDIFNGFSGVDGSAYLVGGVGMTLLTDGKLILAPIRTGIGLRLGANIGYIRFTPRSTWNPF